MEVQEKQQSGPTTADETLLENNGGDSQLASSGVPPLSCKIAVPAQCLSTVPLTAQHTPCRLGTSSQGIMMSFTSMGQ